jgi:hypothetical protein
MQYVERILGSNHMATKITRDALESYLNCKTKALLKLTGNWATMSDYQGLVVASRSKTVGA